MTESGHSHASLDPTHWTEEPLRAHLTRSRSDAGHDLHPVNVGAWGFNAAAEHGALHPEGDDRQVPEVLRT